MPHSLNFRRARAALALCLSFSLMVVPSLPLRAEEAFAPKARSSVTDVASHRFEDGSPGNLGYKVSTEVLQPMAPGEFFPTVRVDARDHPNAFEGQWADQGFHAAWVSPAGSSKFYPDAFTVESAYFDNYLDDGAPLSPGDNFDTAVKQLSFDTPLTWSRERGEADGQLDWDVATKVHRVSGTFGGNTSEMEVMFVRADLVARGGDVDARESSPDVPPLVIDLPRIYGPDVTVGAVSAQFTPYLHYIRNLEGQVVGQTGKAVFTADLTGYLPEAKEYTLPGGAIVREWHVPLDIIITAVGRTGDVGRSAVSMAGDGLVKTFGALGSDSVRAPAGTTVITGNGLPPRIEGTDRATESSASTSAAVAGAGSILDDIKALAPIDSSLDEPTRVQVAKRSYDLTIDPNLYGSGNLGVTGARHVRSGREFLAAAAATSVEVDGSVIPLDRSRLVDLRVTPQWDGLRIRFTSRSEGNALLDPSSYSRAREGRIFDPGVNVEAVYDLGDGVYAFYTISSVVDGSADSYFDTYLVVRSLSGAPRHLRATQYVETAAPGPFTYDGSEITHEFSAPTRLIAGDDIGYGGNAAGGGRVTVKRANGSALSEPVADPTVSVAGERLGIYMTSTNGAVTDFYGSYLGAGLWDLQTSQAFPLPEIGQTCHDPVVVDDADSDAAEDLDIRRAWFDYDGSHVYATLELSELRQALLSPARYRAGWRLDHIGYGLQAARDATGEWIFELGLHPSARSQWSRIATAEGEVVYGSPGYIRIKAPQRTTLAPPFLDGEMFRDTGAVSYGSTTTGEGVTDRAPSGAPEVAYGRGRDWLVAPCPTLELPTTLELLDAPYEVQHTDALAVRAILADENGPVENGSVSLTFAGQEKIVSTDASGIAEATFDVNAEPASYPVTATYPGSGDRLPSEASAEATVQREDSALSVAVSGTGSKRRLLATLVDGDEPSSGISDRAIEFYADGQHIGSAVTDDDGIATFNPPPRYRGANHTFEAVFEGGVWFVGSGSRTTT